MTNTSNRSIQALLVSLSCFGMLGCEPTPSPPGKQASIPVQDMAAAMGADRAAAAVAAVEYLSKIGAEVTDRVINIENDVATVPTVRYQGKACALTLHRVGPGLGRAPTPQWRAAELRCNEPPRGSL